VWLGVRLRRLLEGTELATERAPIPGKPDDAKNTLCDASNRDDPQEARSIIPFRERQRIRDLAVIEATPGRERNALGRKIATFFQGPIGLALLGFLLIGILATLFSKQLDDISKAREIEWLPVSAPSSPFA
jgi:hypothetical protein